MVEAQGQELQMGRPLPSLQQAWLWASAPAKLPVEARGSERDQTRSLAMKLLQAQDRRQTQVVA